MKNLFNNKKIKYATFSSILTILVVTVLIVTNLIFESFNISFDMTDSKSNSLSETTISYLDELQNDITIYPLYKAGEVYKPFEEIFDRYDASSSKITVEYVDPYQNPQFVEKYKTAGEDIPVGSVIVEGNGKSKVVSSQGLIEQGEYMTIYNLEPRLTNAIIYVNSDKTPKIYVASGHSEVQLGSAIHQALLSANFNIEYVNIKEVGVPSDCDILLLTTPKNDYTKDESDKISEFLNNGGNAFVTFDVVSGQTPNYDSITEKLGLSKGGLLIVEADASSYVGNIPINVTPVVENHKITETLVADKRVLFTPTATNIEVNGNVDSNTQISTLLSSTFKSYGKANSQSTTLSFEQGDKEGPLVISASLDKIQGLASENVTRLVVVGTSAIINDDINAYVGGGNQEFIVSSMKYLMGDDTDVYLLPKVVTENALTINFSNAVFMLIYSVIFVPLIVLITGTVIFFRRRNR